MSFSFVRVGIFLLTFGFIAGAVFCKNGRGRAPRSRANSSLVDDEMDTLFGVIPTDRPTLIAALKAMGRALGSGDKRQVAKIFSFPIPDSVAHFSVGDTTFRVERDRDSGVTEEVFSRYFEAIDKGVDFGEFGAVFRELDVNKLMKTNGLEIRADTVTEPCTRRYRIEVVGNFLVRISYGVSSVNAGYTPALNKDSVERSDEYADGACEHLTFWNFVWDGRRLKLVRQDAAD